MDVQVKDNGNGTYACTYTPRKPVKHTAMVSWGGVNIPDSPFRVSTPAPTRGGGSTDALHLSLFSCCAL